MTTWVNAEVEALYREWLIATRRLVHGRRTAKRGRRINRWCRIAIKKRQRKVLLL